MNGFIIEKDPVSILSVLPERLAMIRHHSNHGVVVNAPYPQLPQELSDRGIHVGNLAVVGRARVLPLVRFRRIVRMVRIIKVHPQKERTFRMRVQPRQRVGYAFAAASLRRLVAIFSRMPSAESGVVGIESAIEAGRELCAGIENDGADKRPCMIPALPE